MALTETQTRALAHAVSDNSVVRGTLFCGNGFSLPTARRLEAQGLATVKVHSATRAGQIEWSARLTDEGLLVAADL